MIFVNLPVRDVRASQAFWNGLGYETNPQFTDERTTNAKIDENIWLMLLERSRFAEFTPGSAVADPKEATGVLVALSADSREAVDDLVDRALAAGAGDWLPAEDQGFMYGRSFQDPDGHVIEVVWMDVAAATQAGALSGASA